MTNERIKKAGTLELAFRMNILFTQTEEAKEDNGVDMAELEEVVAIDRELKERLGHCLKFKNKDLVDLIQKGMTLAPNSFPKESK